MTQETRVLCVDDEKNVLRAIERLFTDDGYEILTAASGAEGLKILENVSPIHVVLSDYRMPGMNGVGFLQEVCRRWPETVRMVLSGYADAAAIVEAINKGQIYKFIPKPWNDEELKGILGEAVERSRLQERHADPAPSPELMRNPPSRSQASLASDILESLPVGVLGMDGEGRIVQCNKRAQEILNGRGAAFLGQDRHSCLSAEINTFVRKVTEEGPLSQTLMIGNRPRGVRGVSITLGDGQEGIVLILEEKA